MTRDYIFRNTFKDIETILGTMSEHGTRFEFECYDVGHLYTLAHFLERGLVKPPLFVQFVFGILGGIGPDVENLLHMKNTAERLLGDAFRWSVLGAGRHQTNLVTIGAIMGGNVRVGLEDSLYLSRGKLAASNAEQVEKIIRILGELSLEVATPDEAREMLALKGPDATKIPSRLDRLGQRRPGVGHERGGLAARGVGIEVPARERARVLDDHPAALVAAVHERLERIGDRVAVAQALGEHDRVLDRDAGAAGQVRRRRVRGVADEDDVAAMPRALDEGRVERAVVHRPVRREAVPDLGHEPAVLARAAP